jgi:hypothetical protein
MNAAGSGATESSSSGRYKLAPKSQTDARNQGILRREALRIWAFSSS